MQGNTRVTNPNANPNANVSVNEKEFKICACISICVCFPRTQTPVRHCTVPCSLDQISGVRYHISLSSCCMTQRTKIFATIEFVKRIENLILYVRLFHFSRFTFHQLKSLHEQISLELFTRE